jgi:glycosyltransferase involved in cell wall biosynthesis
MMSYYFRIPHRIISFSGQVWATKKGWGRFILKMVDRTAAALATDYVSDSQSQIDFLRSEGVLQGQSVEVFGKGSIAGVDLSRFKPDLAVRDRMRSAVGDDQNDFIFLYVGRITREKGISDALIAFEAVRVRYPATKLWLVGPDEDGLLAAREKRGESLPDGVRWLGRTETPEAYMQSADVLVLPSYRESFGVVIIEASACAVPSVAYDIVGVKDAIDQDKTGIMVKLHDIEAFKAAMLSLIENADVRESLKKAGLERVHAYFSAKEITQHWVRYYQNRLG